MPLLHFESQPAQPKPIPTMKSLFVSSRMQSLVIAVNFAIASIPVLGQSTNTVSNGSSQPDQGESQQNPGEVVTMSQFEVTTTQGHGYVANNAATAFKTDEKLMDIPQADIVVTNDLINDMAYDNSSDVLQYFGVETLAEGEYLDLRGSSAYSIAFEDEIPQIPAFEDNSVLDSYEVIKGPAQVLYLNAGLAGVILKATKKPLPYNQDIVTASIDSNGLYRYVGDFSGPLGNIGAVQLSFRFVGTYQHGHT
jgi:outer membrane receptor for ferric coprogen and ferric-rhodotorulic acid